MKHLHLTHPRLDFWVTVDVCERDGRYMATADLGEDSRDVGVGDTPLEAGKEALGSLGQPYATEMATGIRRERSESSAWHSVRTRSPGVYLRNLVRNLVIQRLLPPIPYVGPNQTRGVQRSD